MYISYTSGLELLKSISDDIWRGQYRLLLFFLASQYDGEALSSIVDLAEDIDKLTGPHCMAIAFMPPPKRRPVPIVELFNEGLLPSEEDKEWGNFIDRMTRNTYDLAMYFNIPYDTLPCLVFLAPGNENRFAVLHLDNTGLYTIFKHLRSLFFSWYSNNGHYLENYDKLTILANAKPSQISKHDSSEKRRFTDQAL